MKTQVLLVAACLLMTAAAHAQKINTAISADQLAEVKDFLVAKPGDVVKLMVISRGTYDRLEDNGTIRSSVTAKESPTVHVVVPPELAAWFKNVGDYRKPERSPRKIYGIVVPAAESFYGRPTVKLIGREIRGTSKGKEMLW